MSSEASAAPALTALVVYESMFGCTAEVARAVADGLVAEGVDTDLVEVHDAPPADEGSWDLLVVGAPTHAFSLSRPSTREDAVRQGAPPAVADTGLREWLAGLHGHRSAHGRPAAAFDTRVTAVRRLPKAAGTRASHLLSRAGYSVVARPAPFLVQDTQGPLVDGEVDRAAAWGRTVAQAARRRTDAHATSRHGGRS